MAACLADVEQGKEVCCLTGGSEHCCSAALQLRNFCRYVVAGRVLQTGVKIACSLQVEKLAHRLARVVLKGCGLDNRNLARFTIARFVTAY